MSSPLENSKWILRSGLLCAALLATGCMKPLTNGQTVIDPSHDGAPDPTEVYNPEVFKQSWREDASPKTDIDLGEMLPERRAQPAAKVRLQGDLPDVMMDDEPVRGDEPGSVAATPRDRATVAPTGGATGTPATRGQTPAPETELPATSATTAEEPAARRRFQPIPAPKDTTTQTGVTAPTARTTGVTGATGPSVPRGQRGGVTAATAAPTGPMVSQPAATGARQGQTAASGRPAGVTAPTARVTGTTSATGPMVSRTTGVTAATASTDVSGRRRFRPVPRPEAKPGVTAATGVAAPSGTVTAPSGQVTAPSGKVTAPSGKTTATAPSGKTTVTAPTGRATSPRTRTRTSPKTEEKPQVAVPTPAERETNKPATTTTTPPADGYSVRVADNRDIAETGTITPTIYFLAVVDEDKESCADKVGMYLTNGSVAMTVCRRTASFCSEQGSCLIKKGGKWQTFNIVRRVNGIDRYVLISDGCTYGYGVRNICLDPFYSVAADLSVYDPGDVIFIPKLRGLKLPNGQRHDGYVIVRDQGRGIKGRGRFDFFSGAMNWGDGTNPFVKVRLNDKNTDMTYHKVAGDLAARVKAKRGYPKLPSRGAVHSALNQGNTRGVPTSPLAQPGGEVQAGHGTDEHPR